MDVSIPVLAVVAAVFTIKHFVADFLLQTSWIARGKESPDGWRGPIALHAGTHAAGTLLIVLVAAPSVWWLAPVDFVVHAAIDRGKSLVAARKKYTPQDAPFWWLLGFDQCLHQLTNIAMAVVVAVAMR